jgi:uncharacterized membrane protein
MIRQSKLVVPKSFGPGDVVSTLRHPRVLAVVISSRPHMLFPNYGTCVIYRADGLVQTNFWNHLHMIVETAEPLPTSVPEV